MKHPVNQAPIPVSATDLPAYCPDANQPLWSRHPRVSLTFNEQGDAVCYYCSARYHLVDTSVRA